MKKALPWIIFLAIFGMVSEQDYQDQLLASKAARSTYASR